MFVAPSCSRTQADFSAKRPLVFFRCPFEFSFNRWCLRAHIAPAYHRYSTASGQAIVMQPPTDMPAAWTDLAAASPFDTSAKLALLKFLCERLVPGVARALPLGGEPRYEQEMLAKLVTVLNRLGICGTAEVVQGHASEQEQLAFFGTLTVLVEDISSGDSINAQQQASQPGADAQLLALACSQLESLLSTDLRLFGSSSSLQKVYEQAHSSKAAGLLRQQLQGSQQVQTALIAPSRVHADQPRVKLEVEPQQIEECMDTFLNVAEDFDRLFHQELEPWTSTMAPAALHDIGPMALEAQHSYFHLQNLLAAISNTQSAHQRLSVSTAQADAHSCSKDSLADIQAKHAGLKLQQQLLLLVEQRLSTSTTRQPQLADL